MAKGTETVTYEYDVSLLTEETLVGTLNLSLGYQYNDDFALENLTYAGSTLKKLDKKIIESFVGDLALSVTDDILFIKSEKNIKLNSDDLKTLFGTLISNILFSTALPLPSERNAFILTYKLLSNRRYKLLKDAMFSNNSEQRQTEILKGQADIGYPKPLEDFLEFLADMILKLQMKLSLTQARKMNFKK